MTLVLIVRCEGPMLTFALFSAGASIFVIGGCAMVGWLAGIPELTTWGVRDMPMAPGAALMSGAMGTLLMLCAPARRPARCIPSLMLSVLSLALCAAFLILRATGEHLQIERLGFQISGMVYDLPAGVISPVAAVSFALSAIAFAMQWLPGGRKTRLIAALSVSAIVTVTGVATVLALVLGYPMLARSARIPLAASTSVVLIILGCGLAAIGVRLFDRSAQVQRARDRSWRRLVFAFVAVTWLALTIGYATYRQEEKEIRDEALGRLDAISVVKTTDVARVIALKTAAGLDVRTRRMPDSGLTLVLASDSEELQDSLWERLRWILSLVGMLLVSAATILALIWRNHRTAQYRARATLAEAIRAQATRVTELAARSPAVLYTLRCEGSEYIPIDMSANVERILGYRLDEALDPAWFPTHLFPEDRAAALEVIAALDTSDELVNEFRFIRKDGSVLWVLNQMAVTRREAGRPVEITGAWQDISERRKAEAALRESEERLRLALGSAAQGLWDLNIQTDEAVVSPEYVTMLGYDPEEFRETNTAWRARLHPDDRPTAEATYLDYVAGRRSDYSVEFRQRTATGEWKWILSVGKVIARSADGLPLRMIGTHTDITARKIAELRSERLAELYEALSTCNFAVAHCSDQNELFQRVSVAAAGIRSVASAWIGLADPVTHRVVHAAAHGAGPTRSEWVDVSTDDVDIGRGPTGTAIRENRPCWLLDLAAAPEIEPWRALAQQYGWVAAGSFPLRCEGRAVGALSIYANSADAFDDDSRRLLLEMASSVSSALDNMARERRRAAGEEALRESEERYRALFADTDVPRLVLDQYDGRIVDANAAASSFYGWPLAELRTMNISDINTLSRDEIRARLEQARTGTQRSFDFQHRLASGKIRDVQVFGTTISFNGETLLLSTVFDVTESKRAAAVLRTALQEREALLKEVHHRVKNNLQVISSLLRLERERHEDASVKSAMADMQLRILSMALLHETLYQSTDLGSVDLAAYLTELAGQVFRSAAPPTGAITLQLDLAPMLVDIDHAVPCGLLVNEILSNCLKHAFPDGRVGTVSIALQPAADRSAYVLRIRDTGIGLPANFESRRTGSLGVQLIRVLTKQLKGSLAIEHAPGATFSIAFVPPTLSSNEATP